MREKLENSPGLAALMSVIIGLACPSMAAAQEMDPVQALARADANGDGAVSRSEVVALRTQSFGRLDRNKDGYISAADRPRGPFGARFDEAFRQAQGQFDQNGDSRVSRSEMIDAPSPIFTKGDTDRNGTLSAEELKTLSATAPK